MYQKGTHEKRYAEKRYNYHNCTDYSTLTIHYAVHVGLLPSTGNGLFRVFNLLLIVYLAQD